MTLSITKLYHYAECHFAECRVLFGVMLSVIMLSVTMLSVIMLSVIMLSVVAHHQHDDTQHNDTQHYSLKCNDEFQIFVTILSSECSYTECPEVLNTLGQFSTMLDYIFLPQVLRSRLGANNRLWCMFLPSSNALAYCAKPKLQPKMF
jgi:hypothetical protein